MSISSEIERIKTSKESIAESIKAKGVQVSDSDKIDSFSAKIGMIQAVPEELPPILLNVTGVS